MNDDSGNTDGVIAVDAADLHLATFTTRSNPLVIPRRDAEDRPVGVLGRDLARCRELATRLRDEQSKSFEWHHTLLGAGLGGIIGGIAGQLSPLDWLGFAYYAILIGLSAYMISGLRTKSAYELPRRELAQSILDTIPDPNDVVAPRQ